MLKQLSEELRALPVPLTHQEHRRLLAHTLRRLIDTVRSAATSTHPSLNALAALFFEVLKAQLVQVALVQKDLPRACFALGQHTDAPPFLLILFPPTYLEEVREDPLHKLAGLIFIASWVRDDLCQQLSHSASETRARAFEAELLLWIKREQEREGFPWTPNGHQQAVLQQFPQGLANLPRALAYATPPCLIVKKDLP
jgi:hypothetical protein